MIRSRYLSTFALAALLGAAPAFAQNSMSTSQTASKPLCSELNNKNAGKLANKSTGKAAEHSSSAVHQDCVPDSSAASAPSASTSASQGANTSASGSATASPSNTGSTDRQPMMNSLATIAPTPAPIESTSHS